MGSFANRMEDEVLDHVFRATAYSAPTNIYAGLFTAVTDLEIGLGTEVSGNGYARSLVTFAASASGVIDNNAVTNFPTASGGAWGTITHEALFESATPGSADTMTSLTTLAASKVVGDGDTYRHPLSSFTITLD